MSKLRRKGWLSALSRLRTVFASTALLVPCSARDVRARRALTGVPVIGVGGRFLHAAIITALASIPVTATTILAHWTPREAIIGADSKMLLEFINRTSTRLSNSASICKVFVAQNVLIWAVAGMRSFTEVGRPPVDVQKFVAEELSKDNPLPNRLATIESALRNKLETFVNDQKKRLSPVQFLELTQHQAIIKLTFGYLNAGMVEMDWITISADDSDQVKITVDHCPSNSCQVDFAVAMGFDKEILPEFKNPLFWVSYRGDEAKAIERLITEEAQARPHDVGLPVSLVQLTADGPKWIERGACAGN